MNNYNQPYLEKYSGRASRHKCPKCGDPHSFAYYLDGNTGQPIDKTVGRCNHESGCGYHYTPKQFFIDNLTYLCIASEKGDVAGALMFRLMALKKKHGLSLLVLAHTPKRCLSNPITQNDLAGSKKLYNFFDSVFAIGKSAKDSNLRYIKQLKVRYGNYTYDSDNVIVAAIEKVGTFLQFVNIGYATEKEHLKEPSEKDVSQEIENVKLLSGQGKSIRDMAKELNISKSKVGRILKQD